MGGGPVNGPIPVCCLSCGEQACVNRVTANLRCACGSSEVDLVDGTAAQQQHLATLRLARMSFLDFMRTGTSSPVGSEIKGWNVFQGPAPSANPYGQHITSLPCPVCHGSKFDIQDGGLCRACGGDGVMTPTTSVEPEPLVARHPEPTTQTRVPFMGHRRTARLPTPEEVLRETTGDYGSQGQRKPHHSGDPFSWSDTDTHYPRADHLSPATRHREERDYSQPPKGHFSMPGAACPNCGEDPTFLVKDHKEDAWWNCRNCGPLANIDKRTDLDPYSPPEGFLPNPKGYKAPKKTASYHGVDRGSVLRIASTVQQANPGLTPREVVHLARTTVSRYLEKP